MMKRMNSSECIKDLKRVSKAIGVSHNIRLAGSYRFMKLIVFREGVEEDVELTEFSMKMKLGLLRIQKDRNGYLPTVVF